MSEEAAPVALSYAWRQGNPAIRRVSDDEIIMGSSFLRLFSGEAVAYLHHHGETLVRSLAQGHEADFEEHLG
jgi:hypothetical protein